MGIENNAYLTTMYMLFRHEITSHQHYMLMMEVTEIGTSLATTNAAMRTVSLCLLQIPQERGKSSCKQAE